MDDEEIKFEMVKKILEVDPLSVDCNFCFSGINLRCKNGLYQQIMMPHTLRWKAAMNKDKPVVKKRYRVTAEKSERILVGEFEAISAKEAIITAQLSEGEFALQKYITEEIE